jgi:hypothetical protein
MKTLFLLLALTLMLGISTAWAQYDQDPANDYLVNGIQDGQYDSYANQPKAWDNSPNAFFNSQNYETGRGIGAADRALEQQRREEQEQQKQNYDRW